MIGLIANNSNVVGMPAPVVGMGAIAHYVSDRRPYSVAEVLSEKKIAVKADNYSRVGEEWKFYPNPLAGKIVLSLRKNGWWIPVGESMKDGLRFGLGKRDYYYDPHF